MAGVSYYRARTHIWPLVMDMKQWLELVRYVSSFPIITRPPAQIASTWIERATSRFSEVVGAHPLSMRTAAIENGVLAVDVLVCR